jgi:hypothetical protein
LLDAIEAKKVPRTDLTAFAVRQIGRFNDETVNKRLNEVWGTLPTAADKTAEIEQWKKTLTPKAIKEPTCRTAGRCSRRRAAPSHAVRDRPDDRPRSDRLQPRRFAVRPRELRGPQAVVGAITR